MRLAETFARGPETLFQPQVAATAVETEIQKRLAKLVGLVAFFLPVVLFAGTLAGSCFRDSISHFYYAQFLGAVFVGMLVFIGGFLIAYTGEHWLEDLGSVVAGVGAFLVAVFPTTGDGCERMSEFHARVFVNVTAGDPPTLAAIAERGFFVLFPRVENLHAWGAAILFTYLALYCWFVLARVVPERHKAGGRLIETKYRRNILYRTCALVILACVATLGLKVALGSPGFVEGWNALNLTFYVETVALWAFGLAWWVKGRSVKALNDPPQAEAAAVTPGAATS